MTHPERPGEIGAVAVGDRGVASSASHRVDLRGEPCPMNYVRAQLALEDLSPGDVLEAWVDAGDAARGVQKSAAEDRHRIVRTEEEGPCVRMWIEKAKG